MLDGMAICWKDEHIWRREKDVVWSIECKEACPNVGGEKRSSTHQQARWLVRRGRPAVGRDVVIDDAYEQQ